MAPASTALAQFIFCQGQLFFSTAKLWARAAQLQICVTGAPTVCSLPIAQELYFHHPVIRNFF